LSLPHSLFKPLPQTSTSHAFPHTPTYIAAPTQNKINPIIDRLTRAFDRLSGLGALNGTDDEPDYAAPTSQSYTRLTTAARSTGDELQRRFGGAAAAAAQVLAPEAPSFGKGAGGVNIMIPAVNFTVPDHHNVVKNTIQTVTNVVASERKGWNSTFSFFKDTWKQSTEDLAESVKEGLKGAIKELRKPAKSPPPQVASAQVAPVIVVQPVPATTVVPVVSTAEVRPTYYTKMKPMGKGKGFFGF
jgi:hypothetical protein